MKILAIESSCDETAAAVVENGTRVISNVVASSHDMHEKYGGIVPEVAARIQLSSIIPVITEAMMPFTTNEQSDANNKLTLLAAIQKNIDAIAITVGPGLIGSLLVGVETAKTIAFVTHKPIIPVNHVLAHMYANFVDSHQSSVARLAEAPTKRVSHQKKTKNNLKAGDRKLIAFPAISLVVSGGHTELYLMKNNRDLTWLGGTLDDAAGECFDKTARLLGFGHGGGLAIQKAASEYRVTGNENRTKLPRPMLDKKNELNFSFSGLKTAILREVQKLETAKQVNDETIAALSYEVQEAITDVLVKKTLKAADKYDVKSILLSGGVSANVRLREKFTSILDTRYSLHAPPIALCTDNAVYIGSYAFFRGTPEDWKILTAHPDLSVEVSL